MNIINGTGYVVLKIYGDAARTSLYSTINMPYTELGGYTERWIEERLQKRMQKMNLTTPGITERQLVIGEWGEWDLSWASLSIPKDIWLSVADMISGRTNLPSARQLYFLSIVPRHDYAEPEREFAVNYTGESLDIMGGTGGDAAAGTKGLRLKFRTESTHAKITIVNPDGVNYRGSHSVTGTLRGQTV